MEGSSVEFVNDGSMMIELRNIKMLVRLQVKRGKSSMRQSSEKLMTRWYPRNLKQSLKKRERLINRNGRNSRVLSGLRSRLLGLERLPQAFHLRMIQGSSVLTATGNSMKTLVRDTLNFARRNQWSNPTKGLSNHQHRIKGVRWCLNMDGWRNNNY